VRAITTKTLAREWLALVAILIMLLGPLALGVSRGLGTQQRVAVAAGLSVLPVCAPGDALDGTKGTPSLAGCDHCLPCAGGPLPVLATLGLLLQSASVTTVQRRTHNADPAATGLPPATGPPIS
jgi:hypothetical protein